MLKTAARGLLPPALVSLGRAVRDRVLRRPISNEWEAVPSGDQGWQNVDGWMHDSIVSTQRASWAPFIRNAAEPNSLGVWPGGVSVDVGLHNLIMTFAYAIGRAAIGRTTLSLLDWGGGLGHYYVYARELFPDLHLSYTIRDLAPFCRVGAELLSGVRFIDNDTEAFESDYDIVFASGSVHYRRDIYPATAQLAGVAKRWLMISRLPCVEQAADFTVIQRPHGHGYFTEYPCWFVNRRHFITQLERCGFVLRREFVQSETPVVSGAPEQCRYYGFLFERSRQAQTTSANLDR